MSARAATRLPPGPPGTLLQLLLYAAVPGHYVSFCAKRYGELFTVPTPYGPVLVVGTPDAAREVLATDQGGLTGFASDSVEVFLGPRSLMLIGGEDHRRERRVLAPLFHSARMRTYTARIAQLSRRHLEMLRPGVAGRPGRNTASGDSVSGVRGDFLSAIGGPHGAIRPVARACRL